MRNRIPGTRLSAFVFLLCTAAHAQWLNYRDPGVPRTRDGKVNLTAPAPKAANGKPDLSGVWMHEITTPAEMKRLYGSVIDEAIKVDVPGMEIGTQHKYAMNILLDFKSDELVRPEALERMHSNASQHPLADACTANPSSSPSRPKVS